MIIYCIYDYKHESHTPHFKKPLLSSRVRLPFSLQILPSPRNHIGEENGQCHQRESLMRGSRNVMHVTRNAMEGGEEMEEENAWTKEKDQVEAVQRKK